MKKIGFALLALVVAAITFAFTKAPEKRENASAVTYYAFDATGTLLGSAGSTNALKSLLCPGANTNFCAQVWDSIDVNQQPAGLRQADIKKP